MTLVLILANFFFDLQILTEKQRNVFEKFVPRTIAELLDKESIIDLKLGDQARKEMTILFADIRSFTTLSEKMTPEENFNFLNSYLKRMSPIVESNYGFIDKFIGDAVMALFSDSVNNALDAAIEMQQEIVKYNDDRAKAGYDPIQIGIGLHYGSLMLGTIGTENRMEGTVISDAVNTASRVESLTKKFKAKILVSKTVINNIRDSANYSFRFVGSIRATGKEIQTSLYEVYDYQDEATIELITKIKDDFEFGVNAYHRKDYSDTIAFMKKSLAIHPDDYIAGLYLDRALRYHKSDVS